MSFIITTFAVAEKFIFKKIVAESVSSLSPSFGLILIVGGLVLFLEGKTLDRQFEPNYIKRTFNSFSGNPDKKQKRLLAELGFAPVKSKNHRKYRTDQGHTLIMSKSPRGQLAGKHIAKDIINYLESRGKYTH